MTTQDMEQIVARRLTTTATFEGVGVHTGAAAHLIVEPAEAGFGLRFVRTDLPGHPEIPVHPDSVRPESCNRCTVLERAGHRISTCEHLLSALAGLNIWNARLLLNGPEVPFLDGSAEVFHRSLLAASQPTEVGSVPVVRFLEPLVFESGLARYTVLPSDGLRVTYFFKSDQPMLRFQVATFDGTDYGREVAPARTFGFLDEVGPLLSAGLAKGASLANSVVFGRRHLLNNGLRFEDEPSRHKILDFLGDLAPLSARLTGWFFCVRSGHRTNAEFVRYLHEGIRSGRGLSRDLSPASPG